MAGLSATPVSSSDLAELEARLTAQFEARLAT